MEGIDGTGTIKMKGIDGTGTTREGGGPSEFMVFHQKFPVATNTVLLTPGMFTMGLGDEGKSRF